MDTSETVSILERYPDMQNLPEERWNWENAAAAAGPWVWRKSESRDPVMIPGALLSSKTVCVNRVHKGIYTSYLVTVIDTHNVLLGCPKMPSKLTADLSTWGGNDRCSRSRRCQKKQGRNVCLRSGIHNHRSFCLELTDCRKCILVVVVVVVSAACQMSLWSGYEILGTIMSSHRKQEGRSASTHLSIQEFGNGRWTSVGPARFCMKKRNLLSLINNNGQDEPRVDLFCGRVVQTRGLHFACPHRIRLTAMRSRQVDRLCPRDTVRLLEMKFKVRSGRANSRVRKVNSDCISQSPGNTAIDECQTREAGEAAGGQKMR